MTFNCVGIFCEDIREEISGTHTIVGVMPDNISVAGPSNKEAGSSLLFPKMGIYLRLNIDISHKPVGAITARASIPGLADMTLGELGPEAIERAFVDAAAKNLPFVGIIFKAFLSPLQLPKAGVATAFVKVEEMEIPGAILNIQIT